MTTLEKITFKLPTGRGWSAQSVTIREVTGRVVAARAGDAPNATRRW